MGEGEEREEPKVTCANYRVLEKNDNRKTLLIFAEKIRPISLTSERRTKVEASRGAGFGRFGLGRRRREGNAGGK